MVPFQESGPRPQSKLSDCDAFAGLTDRRDDGRVFGLDTLRAAAVLGVLVAHDISVLYPHFPRIGVLGQGGFYGVELFFVLSGFLIGRILISSKDQLANPAGLFAFYLRRWFRTLPLFWLLLVGNVVLDRFLAGSIPGERDIVGHALFLRNFGSLQLQFMPESWSLAVEEWFYLVFPAMLWLGLQFSRRFNAVLLGSAIVLYMASFLARVVTAAHGETPWLIIRVVVVYRFDAIMTGILAAWISQRFPEAWRRHARVSGVVGLLMAALLYLTLWRIEGSWLGDGADSWFARTLRFNLLSLAFALLLPVASEWRVSRITWPVRLISSLALWSYSIYLVQHPIYRLVMGLGFRHWQTSTAEALGLLATLVTLTVATSAFLHRFYEAPGTRLREKALPLLWALSARRGAAGRQ